MEKRRCDNMLRKPAFFLLLSFLFPVFTFSQDAARVTLEMKEGEVFRWNPLEARWDDLPLKSSIGQGAIVKTGEKNSRAVFAMGKKAIVTLSVNSVIRINAALFEKDEIKDIKIQLSKGKIWSVVEKIPAADRKFVIETPNSLSGVRGTIFAVDFLPAVKSTSVGVLSGEVLVGSKSLKETVLLKSNMSTVVVANGPPVSPRALDEKEKMEWERWKESIPFSEIGIVGGIAEINAIQIQEASRIVREVGIAKKGSGKVMKDFDAIGSAILLFYSDTGRVPARLKDLMENGGVQGWKGPYLGSGTNFMDPYGRPYQYKKSKTPGGKEYLEIYTFGLVGAAGAVYGAEKKVLFIEKLAEEAGKLKHP